jgi:drug/metabolite transporter (DMT)-like permease
LTAGVRGPRAWIADFVLLAAVWGGSFLFMRLALPDFGPLPTAAVRVAIAAAVLVPVVAWRGQLRQLRRGWLAVGLVGLLNSGLPFALYSFALQSISTGFSAILNATLPLFGALVAWAWLGDRPGLSRAIGLALGFGGVALLAADKAGVLPGATAPGLAILACLGATLSYAVAATAAKRYLGGIPPLVSAAGSLVGATAALAAPAWWTWPSRWPGLQAWGALLAVGVVCTALAYILYFRLIEEAGPARAMAVTYLVPVFALLYGVLFLAETVTPWMLGCAAVILLGTALSTGVLRLPRRATVG